MSKQVLSSQKKEFHRQVKKLTAFCCKTTCKKQM